jgi:hypothetical protein
LCLPGRSASVCNIFSKSCVKHPTCTDVWEPLTCSTLIPAARRISVSYPRQHIARFGNRKSFIRPKYARNSQIGYMSVDLRNYIPFSRAWYEVSNNQRCCGSILAASAGPTVKNAASNAPRSSLMKWPSLGPSYKCVSKLITTTSSFLIALTKASAL